MTILRVEEDTEEIINLANQAGWQVANLDDGFGERLKRYTHLFAAAQQKLQGKPALKWFSINEVKPPENKNVVAVLDSGVPIFGRNISGRFCVYDALDNRFYEWSETNCKDVKEYKKSNSPEGFYGIHYWAEVVHPKQPENELNSRILLTEALGFIQWGEQVDKEWLIASIDRHLEGDSLCQRQLDSSTVVAEVDEYLKSIGLPSYSQIQGELNELHQDANDFEP